MAGIKIVDLPPLGRDLASTDLLELSLAGGTGSRKITGQEIMNASKLSINNTPIINGTVGRVLFQGTGNVLQQSSSLFWDATNNRLGIGTSSPTNPLDIRNADATMDMLRIQCTSVNGYSSIGFFNNAGVQSGGFGYGNASANALPDVIYFYSINKNILFNTNGGSNERMRIAQSSGNVLIGTTTDAGFMLDVNGVSRIRTFQSGTPTILNIHNQETNGLPGGAIAFYTGGSSSLASRIVSQRTGPIGESDIALETTGVKRLFVAATSGNVLINTTTDNGFKLDVNGTARVQGLTTLAGTMTASGAIARNGLINGTLVAAANNDVLVGLDINPTFTNGAFTGVSNIGLRATGNVLFNTGLIPTSNATTRLEGSLNYFTHNRIASSGAHGFQISNFGTVTSFFRWDTGTYDLEIGSPSGAFSQNFKLFTAGSERMRLSSGGNVLIGTTTDAGFRLDVNGTARVQSTFTVNGNINADSYIKFATSCWVRGFSNTLQISDSGVNPKIALHTASGTSYFNSGGNYVFGATTANASAMIQIDSTTQGFLPPRMTQAQRNAIASPAIGLEIYQTDATEGKYIYKSSGWTYIG